MLGITFTSPCITVDKEISWLTRPVFLAISFAIREKKPCVHRNRKKKARV